MATKRKTSRRKFGAIRQLPSGRYQARYRGPDGVSRAAPLTFATVADADAYLATVYADIVRGAWKAPTRTADTVSAYVGRWITENPRLKESTRTLYRNLLALNIEPYELGKTALSDVTTALVQTWNADLSHDVAERVASRARKSTATNRTGQTQVAQSYRLLRAALTTATDHELIQRNPCRSPDMGKEPKTTERPIASVDDVTKLAAAMPPRYRLMVTLAAYTAARQGELAALRRMDIDVDAGTMRIAERAYWVDGRLDIDRPKSAASDRTLAIPTHLLPAITEHLDTYVGDESDSFIFTTRNAKPVTSSGLTPIWHRARAKAGRPDMRWHDLRHTGQHLASLAGATSAELRHRMGHSTAAASMVYEHSTDAHGRAVADQLSSLATDTNVIPLRPVVRRTATH